MTHTSRREFLRLTGGGAVALGAGAWVGCARDSADQLVVADPGGPFAEGFGAAFYEPFHEATGVEIVNVAWSGWPNAQVRAMVETGTYTWDVVNMVYPVQTLLHRLGMLEELDWSDPHMNALIPQARTPVWMGTAVYGTVLAYRSDTYRDSRPRSWSDLWNVEAFPGRRALRRSPVDTLEVALLADGVDPKALYPLDVDRAFAALDRIRPHVDVWWSSGAQTSQLLESGEVDLLPTWNARAQTVVDGGAPVALEWNQGLYSLEGWAIPAGSPKAELGKEFIRFCADPERQARFTETLAYGPTNPSAYDHIAPERTRQLPTAPENFERLVLIDPDWWDGHKDEVEERFTNWLLS